MIYICADDYGISNSACLYIQKCIEKGALNKVSVLPNFDKKDLNKIFANSNIKVSLHLNLIEGKCMSDAEEINLIAYPNGDFKHTFLGLFKSSLIHTKEFNSQVYKEIRAQVLFWKSILPEDKAFCIDSHQHIHMIPAIFRILLKVLSEEKIDLEHIRIPAEPILPYIKTPSLYFTYRPANITKQWLLKFLWLINKSQAKKHNIIASHFFGILFSGKMDEKRVLKILPEIKKLAEKDNTNIEVLFHPGLSEKSELDSKNKNIVFEEFYISENRKTEFDSVINISERSVINNALY